MFHMKMVLFQSQLSSQWRTPIHKLARTPLRTPIHKLAHTPLRTPTHKLARTRWLDPRPKAASHLGHIYPLLLTLALGLSLIGCTEKASLFKTGQMPFSGVEPAKILQLDVAKADPKTADNWATRLNKSPSQGWEIQSGPGGRDLTDRRAADGFILHLLDTLRTLQVKSITPEGPAESFGLKPPRFALRWSAPESTGPTEIEIGSEATNGAEGTFARIAGQIYTVEGATLQMLAYIENFATLRERTWLAPLTADDIDEIELTTEKGKFYAQREGDVWTDSHHKPIPSGREDLSTWLETFTHFRVQDFLDDPEAAKKIRSALESKPVYTLNLKDRQGKETRIRLRWLTREGEEGAYSTLSSRPQTVARVFAELMRKVESLKLPIK